ncbi:glycosyltransferase family 61 protein [Methylobacterium sp. WL18]|nr:glycosyltransferase family 61 protein [Methylobacterium sp. WL18]
MRPTPTFLDLIRTIDSGNASRVLEELEALLSSDTVPEARVVGTVRHLETLGFCLEGSDRFGEAARAYELAALVDTGDRVRWQAIAAKARLHDLISRALWDEASAFVTEQSRTAPGDAFLREQVASLLRLGWDHECRYAVEPSVQCYRLAYELNGGDAGVVTGDGCSISTKIRNLRRLQMDTLAEAGRHEAAAILHERTRAITGLGPVGIYDIVSAREAAEEGQGTYHELLAGRRITEPDVKFFDGPVSLASQAGTLVAPPQYVALFKDCLTYPRSNLVLHGQRLIYDLAAHPLSAIADIKDGVNPGQIMTAVWGSKRALVEVPVEVREIDAGLMLFGFQSRQYGHWLLEFAPRMLWFNDPACPVGFPICVDDQMPDTHRQIIALMDERARPIVTLPPVATRFRELGLASVSAFYPFDTRAGLPTYDAIWPGDVLSALRGKVLDRLAAQGVDLRRTGRRIVLSRRGFTQRQLVNEADIIDALTPHGFEVVHPEQLSFAEQVQTYHSADIIVGSASSALINCIFCRPEAKIVALVHDSRSFYFRGFTSLIEASGAHLLFLRGATIFADGLHPMHANYAVPPTQILRAVATISSAP